MWKQLSGRLAGAARPRSGRRTPPKKLSDSTPHRPMGWLHASARSAALAITPHPPKGRSCSPKCDTKHCLTNSKHRHIGAKESVLRMAFEICQNAFLARALHPTGGNHDAPQPPSQLGKGHPSPYSTPLGARFARLRRLPLAHRYFANIIHEYFL